MIQSEHIKSCSTAQKRFLLFKGPGSFKKIFKIGGDVHELKAYRLIPLTPPLLFHFTLPLIGYGQGGANLLMGSSRAKILEICRCSFGSAQTCQYKLTQYNKIMRPVSIVVVTLFLGSHELFWSPSLLYIKMIILMGVRRKKWIVKTIVLKMGTRFLTVCTLCRIPLYRMKTARATLEEWKQSARKITNRSDYTYSVQYVQAF